MRFGELYRQPLTWIQDEAREGGVEGAFEYFAEGDAFDKFDERLDEVGWFDKREERSSPRQFGPTGERNHHAATS